MLKASEMKRKWFTSVSQKLGEISVMMREEISGRSFQVGSNESSDFQVGNEMGSLEDLIDCQVGREEIPYFQVGKGEKMRHAKSLMNSEVSSDQRGELTEKDQRCLLIIGGIEVFLPHSPVEAKNVLQMQQQRRTTNSDCQEKGRNGADIKIYPSRRRACR
jgi:hypothetical protein